MARPLRVEFDGAIYHVTSPGTPDETSSMTVRIATKRDTRIVQAVHRYGYSQREVADSLHLHYATVSRLANEP